MSGLTFEPSYDAGNHLIQLTDSVSGTITHGYDALDRLTGETTPQGSVSYSYDGAGRRIQMTVAGQSPVSYSYDNANRKRQTNVSVKLTPFLTIASSQRSG